MTVIDDSLQGVPQPHDQLNGQSLPEQLPTPPQNRMEGVEAAGPIDTEAEVIGVEMGGLMLGGPSSKFGVIASDVSERFGGIETTPDVLAYVNDPNIGKLPTENLNARLTEKRDENGYVQDKKGQYPKAEGSAIRESRQPVSAEQAVLVTEVIAERVAAETELGQANIALNRTMDSSSYITDVFAGKLPAENLNARLTEKRDANGYVQDKKGQYPKAEGNSINERRGPVSPEQAELILAVSTERQVAQQATERAKAAVTGLVDAASYIDDILSSKLPAENLNARLTEKRDANGYVQDKKGQYPKAEGNSINERRGPVSPEQASFIIVTLEAVDGAYSMLSADAKNLLPRTGINLQNLAATTQHIRQERMTSLVPADIERCDQTLVALDQLTSIVRRNELSKRVTEQLVNGPESARALLASSDATSAQDLDYIVTRLQPVVNAAVLLRCAEGITNTNEPLQDATIAETLALTELSGQQGKDAIAIASLGLRRLLQQDVDQVFSGITIDNLGYTERIAALQSIKIRPSIKGFNYLAERERQVAIATDTLVTCRSAEIRKTFADKAVGTDELIESIFALPMTTPEDVKLQEELVEALAVYLIARRDERPDDFSALFSEISKQANNLLRPEITSLELGRNLEAAKTVAGHFKEVIAPIFQSLRGDERTGDVTNYITAKNGFGKGRQSYVIDVERLEAQRTLTDTEREYALSVEALSIFNPHLTALASEAPEVTQVVLESYFEQLSKTTKEGLQEGQYFPLVLVGLGPNGVTALGEIMRLNPELASSLLAVDSGELPGGPFAVPRGAAWNLNSANERGSEEPTLPDSPDVISQQTNVPENATVRAYGSPLPWYPGERAGNANVRPGSINTTVDYLPTPDDLSDRRYPTNDQLALVLQLQAAMLLDTVALRTEVVNVVPNPNANAQGDKLVTLRMNAEGQPPREVTIATDSVVIASGLGKPNFGFEIEGSRAEGVLEAVARQPESEFPILSDTLSAFKALADKEGEVKVLGDTLVLYGAGNSTDTLIEYVGGLFADAENPTIRNVKKIIVVTENDLSSRPRYAQIRDLRARNGRDNLVQFVSGRVADVALSDDGKQAIILGANGEPIRDKEGQPIQAASVIAATGFRGELDTVLGAYLSEGQSIRKGDGIGRLTLPTNPDISVADKVEADPSIVLIGTASRADFENPAKIKQLPPDSGGALGRNGAENAVAIGFRRPDDQAAMRIFVGGNEKLMQRRSQKTAKQGPVIQLSTGSTEGSLAKDKPLTIGSLQDITTLPKVRRDIASDSQVLSPLFLQSFGRVRLQDGETTTLQFAIEKTKNDNGEEQIVCQYTGGESSTVSNDLITAIGGAVTNPYFLSYWLQATSTRRERDGLSVQISFRNGRLDMKRTYVEPK